MYRSSSGRSSLSSCSRSKESRSLGSRTSHSGSSTSGSTRGRRSPSPRGRCRRSPSSSRSSRRSPSPRRANKVRSPSGACRSRRGSEQRDGSLSRRCSPERYSCSSRRHPQFLGSSSPSRHSESSVEQSLWTEFNGDFHGIDPRERRRPSDRLGSPDSLSDVDRGYLDDDSAFIRGLSSSRSLERYRSHQESPPSSFSTRYDKDYHGRDAFLHRSDYNLNDDCLEDIPRESDRDGKLFTKSVHPSEEERLNPKRPRYDREDRLLGVSTDPQSSLSEKRNYYKRRLSISQMYPDEDFRKLVSSRRKREEEELSKDMCQDCPGSDYVIRGLTNSLQSSESWYLYRPDEAPAMPQKLILKKQNFGSFLRKKEDQESTSEFADLRDDFHLPHERASQDGSGFSHILGRMADFASAQEKRRHSFLEDEEKFLYGDEEDDSNINCPSIEKLTMNGGKESVSPNKRPPSPIQSVKPDTSEGPGIEYEKIHDLLKTLGLDIGVAEIGKGAARTQERLHGKKTLRSLDGPPHKANSSEKDSIQTNTQSSGSDQKNSLSPCGSSQPSDDVSSASISKHTKSKTLEYNNSAGTPEQSFPSISVIPSAPPFLPDSPLPSPVSQYSLSHFSAFLAAQVVQNYPPPAMAPPSYNTYGHCMAYSAPSWPMYTPPQQSNPVLSDVHGLASVIMPLKPTRSNLRVIETVSKVNPEMKRNKSVLVQVPITPTDSTLLSQSSSRGTTERISDGKNLASEKPQVMDEREKLKAEQETQQRKLPYLKTKLARVSKQQGQMLQSRHRVNCEDQLLAEVKHAQHNVGNENTQLQVETETVEKKQSELDKECLNKNPFCEEERNLDHQAELTLIQETECSLKQSEKQKEARDERSTKVARKEELGGEGNANEISEEKKNSYGEKLMIMLALKKDDTEDEKEGEKRESQKESEQSSSEKCSLRKTETNNQSQDQDAAALKTGSTEEGECRKSKSQSGPDSQQKVTMPDTEPRDEDKGT